MCWMCVVGRWLGDGDGDGWEDIETNINRDAFDFVFQTPLLRSHLSILTSGSTIR